MSSRQPYKHCTRLNAAASSSQCSRILTCSAGRACQRQCPPNGSPYAPSCLTHLHPMTMLLLVVSVMPRQPAGKGSNPSSASRLDSSQLLTQPVTALSCG